MSLIREVEKFITNRCDDVLCNSARYKDLEKSMAQTTDLKKYKELVCEQQAVIIDMCYRTGYRDCEEISKTHDRDSDTQI